MQEVLSNTQIDPARILTEAAIFADKVAVDEETVRLRSSAATWRSPATWWTSRRRSRRSGSRCRILSKGAAD